MTNIPTDLLRTFVAVVELRSFTKAAQSMGVTQPAVSAQIKRLQYLLGNDLLDKSTPGVSLTPTGKMVVNYARRLLSINDQIIDLAGPHPDAQVVRIGMSGDNFEHRLADALVRMKRQWPNIRFDVRSDRADNLFQGLHNGEYELLLAVSENDPTLEAYACWSEPLCWMRSDATQFDPALPVPLVAFSERGVGYRTAAAALNEAGLRHELVFISPSIWSLASAVSAGIGVMVLTRDRRIPGIYPWMDAPLPKLPAVYRGIYVREGGDRPLLEQIAAVMEQALHPDEQREEPMAAIS